MEQQPDGACLVVHLGLPSFTADTNYHNDVATDTWTKIGLNNTGYNDQGALRRPNQPLRGPGRRHPYLFGATQLYKINASATARMRGG